jgi:hypothetical protein
MASPTIDDLQRIHLRAADQFPHEYLDVGLGSIGLFLHNPPKNAGYRQAWANGVPVVQPAHGSFPE